MGRFKFSEANNSWDKDSNDALSLSSISSSSSPPAAFEFVDSSYSSTTEFVDNRLNSFDSSSSESVKKDDIKDHFAEIRNVLDALQAKEDAVNAKMVEKDATIAELSAKYAQLIDKTQKMNEEMV